MAHRAARVISPRLRANAARDRPSCRPVRPGGHALAGAHRRAPVRAVPPKLAGPELRKCCASVSSKASRPACQMDGTFAASFIELVRASVSRSGQAASIGCRSARLALPRRACGRGGSGSAAAVILGVGFATVHALPVREPKKSAEVAPLPNPYRDGVAAFRAGNVAARLEAFTQAADLDRNDPRPLLARGIVRSIWLDRLSAEKRSKIKTLPQIGRRP